MAVAPDASAHARMIKSSPAKGAEVAKPPERLEIWYNELLENGFNTVEVYPARELEAAKHSNLVQEKPTVDPQDHTHLMLKMNPLPPGEYVVDWRVLSRDGHSAPGRFTFKIVPR
jgi:methionine-rich copper-binding protein CopC